MFSKDRIDELLELYRTSNNYEDYKPELEGRAFLKRDLVDAKMMVDRWGTVVTHWIFHSSRKEMINTLFPESTEADSGSVRSALRTLVKYAAILQSGVDLKGKTVDDLTDEEVKNVTGVTDVKENLHIWGAVVHFTDDLHPDEAIGLALKSDSESLDTNDSDKITNSIVVFNVA